MFYQLKITRKGTKPPVWRRCTVAADVTFANMAAMLEKLVQYPSGSLYEIEFFQKKVQIRLCHNANHRLWIWKKHL